MSTARHLALLFFALGLVSPALAADEIVMRDLSLDRPLVLDHDATYRLTRVTVTGLSDCAALTLAGRIQAIIMEKCTFGRVYTGTDGKASAMESSGAMVGRIHATETTFFDAENQLAFLKEGSFGKVTFERCRFATTPEFLKRIYEENPWRTWPPVSEFYNIDRLELLDNEFSNTAVIIHPTVKQVVLRGQVPGLQVLNQQMTQVVHIEAGQLAESVPGPVAGIAGKDLAKIDERE